MSITVKKSAAKSVSNPVAAKPVAAKPVAAKPIAAKPIAGKSPEIDKRAEILESMTPELRKIANRLRETAAKGARGTILVKYDTGVSVKQVLEDESTYGANAVEQLAAYLGYGNKTDLYDLKLMAKTYSREEVEGYAVQEMSNGGHISLGHILTICRVNSVVRRRALWTRVFAESMSVNKLAMEVDSAEVKTNKRNGGRKPSAPSSPKAAIQQIFSSFQGVNNRFPLWQESLFDQADAVVADKEVDEALVSKLEEAEGQMAAMEENLQQYHTKLVSMLDKARSVVEARAAGGAASDETADVIDDETDDETADETADSDEEKSAEPSEDEIAEDVEDVEDEVEVATVVGKRRTA